MDFAGIHSINMGPLTVIPQRRCCGVYVALVHREREMSFGKLRLVFLEHNHPRRSYRAKKKPSSFFVPNPNFESENTAIEGLGGTRSFTEQQPRRHHGLVASLTLVRHDVHDPDVAEILFQLKYRYSPSVAREKNENPRLPCRPEKSVTGYSRRSSNDTAQTVISFGRRTK